MKSYKLFILLVFSIFSVQYAMGQDFLFSQYDFMPQVYNPAQTGDYYGSVRIGGIYRDQGFAVTSDEYNTPGFFIDAPIMTGFKKQDWIGIGATFVQDNAGVARLKTGEVRFSLAYHLGLDNRGQNVLTFGIQAGNYFRSFGEEVDLLRFESEITGEGSNDANPLTRSDNQWAFGAGILFRTQPDDRTSFRIGGAVTHIAAFDYSIEQNGFVAIPLTFNAHMGFERQLTEFISINPMLLAQYVGGDYNVALQSYLSIQPDKEKEFYLEPGIGYRFLDAAMLFFGIQYKSFKVRLAYDATLSPMTSVNGTAGALELGAVYIIKINKPPVVKKELICPRI